MNVSELKGMFVKHFPELVKYASFIDNRFITSVLDMMRIGKSSNGSYDTSEIAEKLRKLADAMEKK